jgi:hypothetical protein
MKRIDLIKVSHNVQIGDVCGTIEPNVTEDSLFYDNGELIGFYIKDMNKHSERLTKLSDVANKEFRSKNVPKSVMTRSSNLMKGYSEDGKYAKDNLVQQMSAILGSCPPRPHMRRPYPSVSSVHNIKSAGTFVKAMLMLCEESEKLMKLIAPNIYERQKQIIETNIPKKWRFGNLFTSSISNYNIAAAFHRDAGNLEGCVNVIIAKKHNATGGNTTVPDYNATMDSSDNSMLVYPAWRNVHGVTPIVPTKEGGYRNSLVFYPLKAFKGLD